MKRAIFLGIAAAAATAAVLAAALRERRPDAPKGTWEPVDHRSPGT